MKPLKKLSYLLIISLFLNTFLFAQGTATDDVQVLVQLTRGLSITHSSGDLDFGEIVLDGTAQTPATTPNNGAVFTVAGHPNRNVVVTFVNSTLINDVWAGPLSAPTGSLTFTPNVQYTTAPAYAGALAVSSGSSYSLTNVTGTGYLYLWCGGSLAIAAAQEPGEYVGLFEVTVAY